MHLQKPDDLPEGGHEADERDEGLLQQDLQRPGLRPQQECRGL